MASGAGAKNDEATKPDNGNVVRPVSGQKSGRGPRGGVEVKRKLSRADIDAIRIGKMMRRHKWKWVFVIVTGGRKQALAVREEDQ